MVLPRTVSASIKKILNSRAKLYHNTQSASSVADYVFLKIGKGGNSVKDKMFQTKM